MNTEERKGCVLDDVLILYVHVQSARVVGTSEVSLGMTLGTNGSSNLRVMLRSRKARYSP